MIYLKWWKKKTFNQEDTHTHAHTNGLLFSNNMDGPEGHYTKWNKRKINTVWSLFCLKSKIKKKKIKAPDQENRLVVARGENRRVGEGDQKVKRKKLMNMVHY